MPLCDIHLPEPVSKPEARAQSACLCVAYLEAQAQVSFHIPTSKAQVLIAHQTGCEPAVLQSLTG